MPGGKHFDRLRDHSKHSKQGDYVFTAHNGDRVTRDALYYHYARVMDERDTLKVRHFIRDFTMLLANTGLRFGELRRLKWKHYKVVRGKDEKKKLSEISLYAEMTKNRKPENLC